MPTLADLSKAYKSKKASIVFRDLVKRSDLLRTAQFAKTSHGMWDEDEVATNFAKGSFRSINQGVVGTEGTSKMVKTDLFPYTNWHPVDKAIIDNYPGGLNAYLAKKGPFYVKGAGEDIAAQSFYGTANKAAGFLGLRQIAIENGNYDIMNSGGSGNTCGSLIVVHWDEDECAFLYNNENWGKGEIIKFRAVASASGAPAVVALEDGDGNEYPGYKFYSESYLGLKVTAIKHVAALIGIRNDTGYIPAANNVIDLLDRVDAKADGFTFLYCNKTVKKTLRSLFDSDKMSDADKERRNIPLWAKSIEDIPVITEDNLTQTESYNS